MREAPYDEASHQPCQYGVLLHDGFRRGQEERGDHLPRLVGRSPLPESARAGGGSLEREEGGDKGLTLRERSRTTRGSSSVRRCVYALCQSFYGRVNSKQNQAVKIKKKLRRHFSHA
ncbi:hypothetical protein Naga_101120g1 [Nannochloropsis gaditana]|uniref:Uncharacterized protein n=1 Tax=Nannochloropsis gaditana TaxID=72520 RepID=W7TGF6_9STRA|nr:hypothetical protein Naga_101120g1 [Nannochloropsis gaditana]